MKIVYVYPKFTALAGTERVLVDKMNHLANNSKYEIYILTHEQSKHPFSFPLSSKVIHVDLGVRYYLLYRYNIILRVLFRKIYNRILLKRFDDFVSRINPDIVITTTYHSYLVSMISKCSHKFTKVVESHIDKRYVHSSDSGSLLSWSNKVHGYYDMHELLKRIGSFDVLVALHKHDADDWSKYVRSCVIYNLVHLNPTGRFSSLKLKRVIFVGRYTPQKGIPDLLKVWAIVYNKFPDWSLEMYGDGVLENNLRVEAERIGINVHGAVSDIYDCYLNNSIFVMTSLYEPFGLVLPEAMSCGLPVIAFDCPYGPRNIIKDGIDGYLIKDRNIDEFAQKLCMLMDSMELRKRIGQAAILSSQRFSADQIMPQWIHLFEELTEKSKR